MKFRITYFFLFLFFSSLKAQQEAMYIEEVHISDQVIHGLIDEKYPITTYLKFEEYSPENWLSFSVSGWYYYGNIKKKIPLVGIYHGDGVTLYSFADKLRADSIIHLTSTASNPWEITDELISRSGFLEKFELNYSEYSYSGTWKNDKKELKVSFNTSNIDLDKVHEFLVIPLAKKETKYIALDQIGPFSRGYSIFASDAKNSKVLIKYEINSTANPNGMCGAGMEIGYMLLTFDLSREKVLLDYRTEDIESCLGGFWSEVAEVPNTNGKKLIYTVTDAEDKVRTVTVDGVNFTLGSK
jgi:hypothetical protein